MRRVVLDTNVFISALRFRGKPARVIDWAQQGEFQLLTSFAIRFETHRVLAEKFNLPPDQIAHGCDPIWQISLDIKPSLVITDCVDPDDNRILECAVFGRADCIVTGDKHLLSMHPYHRIEIHRVDAFLDRYFSE